ncbi:MAG: autotransporter-associated beta strand repeat-containing protein [Verrucomicrobiota bacterium]
MGRLNRSFRTFWMIGIVGVLISLTPAQAATLIWTGLGANDGITTTGNWNSGIPVTGDTLTFAGSTRLTPTLSSPLTLAALSFDATAGTFTLGGAGTYTLTSSGATFAIANNSTNLQTINNALTLSASQSWSATSGNLTFGGNISTAANLLTITGTRVTTINGVISGSAGLTKVSNAGTLALNGANTYTGTTTLGSGTSAAGTVIIGNDAAFGSSAVSTGAVTLQTAGGARTLANNFTVNRTLTFLNADNLTINGTVTMNSSRTFTVNGAGTVTFNGVVGQVSGNRRLTKTGSGTLILNGTNTFSGGLTVTTGTLVFGNNAAAGSAGIIFGSSTASPTIQAGGGTRTITNGVTLSGNVTFSGANDLIFTGATSMSSTRTLTVTNNTTFSGVVSGNGGLTKNGTGTLTLSGGSANTYLGTTTVNDGTLVLNKSSGNAMASTSLVIGDSTGVAASAVVQNNASNQIPDGAAVTIRTDGQLNLQGFTEGVGTLTMSGGSVTGTAGSRLDLGGNVAISTTATNIAQITSGIGLGSTARVFTVNDNSVTTDSDLAISGVISGTATASLTKTGLGTMTLSGTNTFSGGAVVNAGMLIMDNASALGTIAANLGDTTGSTSASLAFSSTSGRTVANAITVRSGSSGTATLGGLNTSGVNTFSGGITLNKTAIVTAETGGEVAFSNVITGAGGLTKIGAGIVRLSAANTYTGLTTINAGTLAYGVSDAIAAGAVTIDGATSVLDLGANRTDTVGQVILTNGGTITGSGTSVLSSSANYDLRSGSANIPLGGPVGLLKSTTGTVVLSGVNTYSGTTSVTAGTLQLGVAGSLPATSAVTVSSGATINANGFAQTIGSLAGAGAMTMGAGSLTTGGDNTSTTYSGVISGSSGLVKNGSGTFTLSGANSYTGTTAINVGTLQLGAINAVTTTSAVTVASGATYNLANFNSTIGSIAGAGNVTLGSGTLNTGGDNTSTTFAGVVSGTGAMTKAGSGTLTLTGANTFSGNMLVDTGTVILSAANGSVLSASGITIGTGATLTLDNSGTGNNNANRIGNSTAITLSGGTLRFISNATIVGTAETVGALNASGGASNILITNNIFISSLTFSSLGTIAPGATVNFDSTSGTLGSAIIGPRIYITGQANGLIGGWATVGSDFAEYSTNGVRAYTAYYTDADGINVNDATKIVLLEGTSPSTAYTLTNAGTTTDLGLNLADLATVDLGAANTRTLNLAGGGLIKSGTPATTISGAGRLTAGGTAAGNLAVSVGATNQLTISSSIIDNAGTNGIYGDAGDGVVSLSKADAGTLILSGTNTFTGSVFVNAGVLQVAAEANLGAAGNDVIFGGGTLSITTGFNASTTKVFTVSSDLSGTLDIASSQTLTLGNASGTMTTGNTNSVLIKNGAGSLVIQGANAAFDGTLQINAGGVELRNAQSLGDATNRGRVTLNGGTLLLRNDASPSFSNDVLVSENSTLDVGRLTGTTPAVTHTLGTVSIGAKTLTATGSNGTMAATGSVTLTGNATFNPTTADLSLGSVSGSFGFTKTGAGALILAGSSTYTGATTVSTGTLRLGAAGGVSSASAVSVASGAIFDLNNLNGIIGSLAGAGNVTLGSGTLTTGGDNTSTTFSGVMSGTGGLTKTGSGVFTVSGTNTYSGATTINAGTLRLGSAGGVPSSSALSVSVASGATYDLNNFNSTIGSLAGAGGVLLGSGTLTTGGDNTSTTFSGPISGTGGLTKSGSGTFTLSGASTYSGATTVSNGVLLVQHTSALGSTAGATVVSSGAELRLAGGISVGAEPLTLNGSGIASSGALHLVSGTSSWSGPVTVGTSATITADAGELTLGGAINLGANTLTFAGGGAHRADGIISGAGNLTKSGAGSLTLNAANTFTGTTTVSSGTVNVQNAAAFGAAGVGAVTVASGAALVFNSPDGITLVPKALTLNGTGISGTGAISSVLGNHSWTGGITLASDSTIAVEADSFTASGIISETGGARALVKTGAGTLVLGGNNSYTGATTINAGTLAIAANERISDTSALIIASGATFNLDDAVETVGSLSGAGSITLGTEDTAALTTGGDGTSTTFSGAITGLGDFSKIGAGTQTLTGANTFTGAVEIDGGVLSINSDSRLGNAANTVDFGGGTLRMTSSITMSRTITLSGSGTVDTAGVNSSITSAMTGAGSFVKTGAGTLTLTGANAYTGATTVTGGALQVGSGGTGTTGTGAVTAASTTVVLGTGVLQGSSFTAQSGSTIHPGDSILPAGHGRLSFTPSSGSGTFDFQNGSQIELGITTPNGTSATYAGNALGSAGYNAWADSFTGLGSGNHDLMTFSVSGSGTLIMSGNIRVNASSLTVSQGQVFNLLDWNTLVTANFSGFNLGNNYRNGSGDNGSQFDLPDISASPNLAWDVSRFTTSGVIVVVLIPEPSRLLLLGMALGAMFFRRRRD